MNIDWTAQGLRDIAYWGAVNPKIITKINSLLSNIERTPFSGLGKPEALKGNLSGWWSRRINDEHGLVYRVEGPSIIVLQCRFHDAK